MQFITNPEMQIKLNASDNAAFTYFYLIRKYTNHNVVFTNDAPPIDRECLKRIFSNTPVYSFIDVIYSEHTSRDTADLVSEYNKRVDVLKNVYYSLLRAEQKHGPGFAKHSLPIPAELYELNQNNKFVEEYYRTSKKKTICRFPPEPSGYLHIGHVKAALLNNLLSDELIVRFDDTNQEKGSEVYEKIILEDLELLELKKYKLTRTSDYFEAMISYAKRLIQKGLAYCDDTDRDIMHKERMDGTKSVRRDTGCDDNYKIFAKMIECGRTNDASELDHFSKYCLRAKISVDSKNKALRDPVIFRFKDVVHSKTHSRLSPTYDFACPIADSIEGVTIVLRTNEFRDRNAQYLWFLKMLDMEIPEIKDFSRLNFENTILSKRKLRTIINDHGLTWDDPRVPTIRGIIRLGLNVNVLKEYIKLQGMRQKNTVNSWDKLWSMNKKYIEKTAKRYLGVKKDECVSICFVNNTHKNTLEPLLQIPYNKKDPNMGSRDVYTENMVISKEDADTLCTDEEFTLMHLGNAIVKEKCATKILVQYNPDGNVKLTKRKITWVSLKDAVSLNLVTYGDLTINGRFNKNSKTTVQIYGEKNVEYIHHGETIQFERIGFCRRDEQSNDFVMIPYTEQKRKADL